MLFEKLDRFVHSLCAGVALIGGIGLLFAIVVTCASILLKLTRRLFDAVLLPLVETPWWDAVRPILGEEELVQYGVGLALFAALPWVLYQKGHVKVDLFEPVISPRWNRVLDLLGDICFAAIAYLILTRQWFQLFRKARRKEEPLSDLLFSDTPTSVLSRLRTAEESQILGIKLWPLYTVAEICVLLFFLVALFCVWRSARAVFDPKVAS